MLLTILMQSETTCLQNTVLLYFSLMQFLLIIYLANLAPKLILTPVRTSDDRVLDIEYNMYSSAQQRD